MRNEVPTRLANAGVMLSEAETSLAIAGFRKESEILLRLAAQNDIMKWFAGNIIAAVRNRRARRHGFSKGELQVRSVGINDRV